MNPELKELLERLLEQFDLEDGDWPALAVNTLEGPKWGTVSTELMDILLEIMEYLEELK